MSCHQIQGIEQTSIPKDKVDKNSLDCFLLKGNNVAPQSRETFHSLKHIHNFTFLFFPDPNFDRRETKGIAPPSLRLAQPRPRLLPWSLL